MAQRNSPDLAAARQALAAAHARGRQSGAFPNPTLSYGREQTSRAGETSSQDVVTLDQPLDITGQRGARRKVGTALSNIAEARLAATSARIDEEVTRGYADAVAATRRAILARDAAEAFATAKRVSESRLAGGDVSGYDHRRLRLEAARYTALGIEAIMARDSSFRVLATAIGSGDSVTMNPLDLVDSLTPAPLDFSADSIVTLALARQPDLQVTERDADLGIAEARLAQAERAPVPVLTGGYKGERLATGETVSGFAAGLSFPLPLWDRHRGSVEAAHAEAARRQSVVEGARRHAARDVRNTFAAHQAISEQLAALRQELGQEASNARRAAQQAYTEGEISLLEWLDSVRAYYEAESTYATLWSQYIAHRAALERATGVTLF